MTKTEMTRRLTEIANRHPVHALPMLVQTVIELVSRLPDDPAPRILRDHPHKRFVPIDLTPAADSTEASHGRD